MILSYILPLLPPPYIPTLLCSLPFILALPIRASCRSMPLCCTFIPPSLFSLFCPLYRSQVSSLLTAQHMMGERLRTLEETVAAQQTYITHLIKGRSSQEG